MTNINSSSKCASIGKTLTSCVLLVLLAACDSGISIFGGANGPARSVGGTIARMPDAALTALCEGRASDAVTILTAEPLASPADKFFTALALEMEGYPSRARRLYVSIMQTGSPDGVFVRCGGETFADGNVTDEAARRLATISQDLALLDVDLRPSTPLHMGLPSSEKPKNRAGFSSYSGPVMSVTAPSTQSPFGQWFVHLASYMSIESANKNKITLEKQFPSLAGIIDQWEIASGNGTAIRLGIRVQEKSDAQKLCDAVKSQGKYCAVINTST